MIEWSDIKTLSKGNPPEYILVWDERSPEREMRATVWKCHPSNPPQRIEGLTHWTRINPPNRTNEHLFRPPVPNRGLCPGCGKDCNDYGNYDGGFYLDQQKRTWHQSCREKCFPMDKPDDYVAQAQVDAPRQQPSVPDALAKLGDLYWQRNLVYGDDYKRHGEIMVALFPDGITLKTESDFNRWSCFKEMVTKLGRYAKNFERGGHAESLDDAAVYSQMLKELDGCQ